MSLMVIGLLVNRKKYCPTATQKVRAVYIQNSTLKVTINQSPVCGTP